MAIKINRVLEIKDQEEGTTGRTTSVVRPVSSPVLEYSQSNSRSVYESPEYDLAEINTIEDVDAYVRQAHRRKIGLGFKEGWDIVSKSDETLTYIKKRMAELETAQNKPWRLLLKEVFHDLITKSNAFLVKVRKTEISGGFERSVGTRVIRPVAAYFIMAPETVEIAKDKNGKITGYKQCMPSGFTKEFRAEDVVHFFIDKKTGFSTGTPILTPVKDDIRALRRIEENIDLLVYQNLFPLFQYVVGTTDAPAQVYPDGSTEIDVVKTELEFMPPEGVIVTPERHEINLIGSENRALKAEGYLKHFKERVFAGLGVSAIDMGEGGTSNRNTASTLSENIRDDVKAIQDDFEAQFDFFVLRELLLEGKFSFDPVNEQYLVHLQFREIDIDAKIAWENHVAQMYSQHAITEDELRRAIGKEPIPLDDEEIRAKTYWKLIEEPKAIIASIDEKYLVDPAIDNPQLSVDQPAVNTGEQLKKTEINQEAKAKARVQNSTSGQRAGAARNRPSNQHGTRNGPKTGDSTIELTDNYLSNEVDILLADIKTYLNDESTSDAWVDTVIKAWAEKTSDSFARNIRGSFIAGFRELGLNPFDYNLSASSSLAEDHAVHYIKKLATDVRNRFKRLEGSEDKSMMLSIMDITTNRINAIYETQKKRAYNYGKLMALRQLGDEVKFYSVNDKCESCASKLKTQSNYNPNQLSIDEIPPFHPWCDCTVGKK